MTIAEKLVRAKEDIDYVYVTMCRHVDSAQESGYSEGYEQGHTEGIEEGKKAEYDAFWDAYQENGNRVDYRNGFSGRGWNKATFKPKYDIKPNNETNATAVFRYCGDIDLAGAIEEAGIVLDLSASSFNNLFGQSLIDNIPPLDVRGKYLISTFAGASALKTIQSLKVDETTTYNNTFQAARALENLTIEGVIAQNGFDLQYSTALSADSILSVIGALSSTTSGLTVTLSKTAVNANFPDQEEWEGLIQGKTNWNISLI